MVFHKQVFANLSPSRYIPLKRPHWMFLQVRPASTTRLQTELMQSEGRRSRGRSVCKPRMANAANWVRACSSLRPSQREWKVQPRVGGTHDRVALLKTLLVSFEIKKQKKKFFWTHIWLASLGLFATVESCCGTVKPDVLLIPYQIFTDSRRATI